MLYMRLNGLANDNIKIDLITKNKHIYERKKKIALSENYKKNCVH